MATLGQVLCSQQCLRPSPVMQAAPATTSAFCRGQRLCLRSAVKPLQAARATVCQADTEGIVLPERYRLNNLSPQEGARRPNKRKGRGYGAGQGGTCGFGMRGQKSRAGAKVRPGFEGGQMPLYRRLPKLRGIAGGMEAGLSKYVTINLGSLKKGSGEFAFEEGEEVSLESLQAKRLLNLSGREARLPLKVLGDGDLPVGLTFKAAAFSSSAREKIAAAGGQVVELPGKVKWTRALGKERAAAAEAAKAAAPKGKGKAN